MPTVTFSNGQSVTFNQTPTPQDIDEAAQQLKIPPAPVGGASSTPATQAQAQSTASPYSFNPDLTNQSIGTRMLNGANNLVKDVETPVLSVLATPVQALANATGQPDPYANGVPAGLPFMGSKAAVAPVTPAGLAVKTGQAGQIGTAIASTATDGLTGMMALGGATGLSNGLAGGETDPGQLTKDTLLGTITGTVLHGLGSFGSFIKNAEIAKTGVTEQVLNEIKNADPSLVQQYINTTQGHAGDIRVPTPDSIAENAMVQRAKILSDQVIPQAGAAVGAAKKAAANLPIQTADAATGVVTAGANAAESLFNDINNKVQDMTGHGFGVFNGDADGFQPQNYPTGAHGMTGNTSPILRQVPGSNIDLSEAESKQLQQLGGYLDLLKNQPSVQTASDVLVNLDNMIGKGWNSPEIGSDSPVLGALKYARGAINRSIGSVSPELAQANATFSSLKDLESEIGTQAGSNLQNASLMMRRVLSGDKSGNVIPTLDNLSQITQKYMPPGDNSNLVQHAVLSNWAKNVFGDESTKSLLGQAVTRGENGISSLFGYPKQFVRNALQNAFGFLTPDAEEYANTISQGKDYSFNPIVRMIDSVASDPQAQPIVQAFAKGLKGIGINTQGEKAAMSLAKAYFLNKLTQSQPLVQTAGAMPNVTLPQGFEQPGRNLSSSTPFQIPTPATRNLTQ